MGISGRKSTLKFLFCCHLLLLLGDDRANMVKGKLFPAIRTLTQATHKSWHQYWPTFNNWCDICSSGNCFLSCTNSLGWGVRERSKRKGEEMKKKKGLFLSQAYSCCRKQQNLPISITCDYLEKKIHHNVSCVQRSPVAELHSQVRASQTLLPFLKIGKVSALEWKPWRFKHKRISRSWTRWD